MMINPTVSVLMSVYNGRETVETAVQSILDQSFTDFEFIIIDDGSNDGTADLIAQFLDERIRLIQQENRGLTKSLNRALALAGGRYIARMDADDIADPGRLAAQVKYLDAHPEVVLLGTAFEQIYTDPPRSLVVSPAEEDRAIRAQLCRSNPMCHSSVMMRAGELKKIGGYDEKFKYLQDYELWSRLALHGRLANLPQVMMRRISNAGAISGRWDTAWKRWMFFRKANHLAIDRLNGGSLNKLRTYATIAIFALGQARRQWLKFTY